jgi:hypothetical protein
MGQLAPEQEQLVSFIRKGAANYSSIISLAPTSDVSILSDIKPNKLLQRLRWCRIIFRTISPPTLR